MSNIPELNLSRKGEGNACCLSKKATTICRLIVAPTLANSIACSPTSMLCLVCWRTSRATCAALLTRLRAPTAPTFMVDPSITMASSVVSPFSSGLPPYPTAERGDALSGRTLCGGAAGHAHFPSLVISGPSSALSKPLSNYVTRWMFCKRDCCVKTGGLATDCGGRNSERSAGKGVLKDGRSEPQKVANKHRIEIIRCDTSN
jgi:hypothetical protein